MSEEEKEAIENIDLLVHCLNYGEMKMAIASERQKEIAQELQMLLNLLNKQQKEIELNSKNHINSIRYIRELEKEVEYLKRDRIDNIQVVYGGRRFGAEGMVVKDYISKDKIKELITHYKILNNGEIEGLYNKEILALEELLKEN